MHKLAEIIVIIITFVIIIIQLPPSWWLNTDHSNERVANAFCFLLSSAFCSSSIVV